MQSVPRPSDFTPGPPRHNQKVALLLLSGIVPILSLLTANLAICAMAAIVMTYFLDLLNYRKSTLLTLWGTVTLVWVSCISQTVRPSNHHPFHEMVFCLILSAYLQMYGIWGTVQCVWLQESYPELALFLERVLLSVSPITVIPLQYTTVVAFVGVRMAPFVICVAFVGIHHVFYCGLKSSWVTGLAMQKDEAMAFTALMFACPTILYFTSYHRVLELTHFHIVNVIALFCIVGVYVLSSPKTLWFLDPFDDLRGLPTPAGLSALPAPNSIVKTYRRLLLALCGFGCVHWVVNRILMSRYGHMLLGVRPPHNEIILNFVGCLVVVIGLLSHQLLQRKKNKEVQNALRWLIILFGSVIASVLLAIVAGMPRFYYPLSSLCAASLTAYILDRRNINNFMMFACGTTLTLMWWMFKSFAFLRHDLPIIGNSASLNLQGLFLMIVWCYLCSCVAFALAFAPQSRKTAFKTALYLHAMFVHWIEHVLYSQPEESTYPGYLVFFTSFLGLTMCFSLLKNGVLCTTSFALVASVYVSKVIFFLGCMTSNSELYTDRKVELATELSTMWWASMFACCVLWILYVERQQKLARVHPGIHIVYSFFAACLSITSRHNLVAYVLAGNAPATTLSQIGCVLLVWTLLQVPILYQFPPQHPSVQVWRRMHVMLVACGVTLMFLFSSESTLLSYDSDNDALSLREPWWGRTAGLVFLLSIVATFLEFSPLVSHSHVVTRFIWWAVVGTIGGLSFCGIYLPYLEPHCILFTCISFVMYAFTVDVCHYGLDSHNQPHVIGGGEEKDIGYDRICWWLYGAGVTTMIFTFYLVGKIDVRNITGNIVYMYEIHTSSRSSLLALCSVTNLTLALLLKRLLCGAPLLPGVNVRRLMLCEKHVSAIALVCNYSTVIGLVSTYLLNYWMFGYQSTNTDSILYLSGGAFLLLLHDDGLLFTDLSKGANHFLLPVVCSMSALGVSSYFGAYSANSIRDIILTTMTLPSFVLHLRLIVSNGRSKGSPVTVAVCVVMDLVCVLFVSGSSGFWMGVLALGLHVIELYTSKLFKAWHFEGLL